MAGAQLTIAGATSAQTAPGAGDGVIQLDGGATLFKQDATTTTLGVDVLLDTACVQVIAGKLIGGLQGNAALSSRPARRSASPARAPAGRAGDQPHGGTLEVEPGATSRSPAGDPALQRSASRGRLARRHGSTSAAARSRPPHPRRSPTEIAIGAGATLSIDGGGGMLALADGETLHGAGTLDASLANAAARSRRAAPCA